MPNINDVALKANVSKSTVSNVFNNKNKVSEEVRQRVMDIAEEIGYYPNKLASALTTKRTGLVGVFIDNNQQFREMDIQLIESISLELIKEDKHPVIYMKQDDQIIKMLGTEPIDDAIIVAPAIDDVRISKLVDLSVKPVIIGKLINGYDLSSVDVDNVRMTKEVTELLIGYGHNKIAFINSAANLTISFDRMKGYTEGLKEAGIPFDSNLLYHYDNNDRNGMMISKRLLENNQITAVICASDYIAKSVYEVANELGILITDDLSVIALGGANVFLSPALSIVNVDYRRLGSEAVSLLQKKECPERRTIECYEIVDNESIRKMGESEL